jgi:hypothetical protein
MSTYKEDVDQYQITSLDQEGTVIFWLIVNFPQEYVGSNIVLLSLILTLLLLE